MMRLIFLKIKYVMLRVVLVTGFLVWSNPSFAKESLLDIQEITSPQGITAWLVEDHTLPIIALRFSFKGAGSALDPEDKQGLTQMAANTMDEGAGEYDSATFQKMVTDHNINLYFRASRDHFGGGFKVLTKDQDMAFDLLRLAVSHPRFDSDPLERMREANISRIRGSLPDPDWKAARLMNDIAFAGHPYALNSGGTLTTLKNITAQDLHQFVKTRLSRHRLYVAVMGDITPEKLGVLLDATFGALPAQTTLPRLPDMTVQNGGQTILYQQDIPQTIISMMQPGIGRRHPDYYTAMVMNFILGGSGFGSRLMEEAREKRGLTYGIYSGMYDLEHVQALTVNTSTKNESVAEVLALIHQEWRDMRTAPVNETELANAQSYLIGSFPLSLSTSDDIASLLLGLQLDSLPVDYLDHRTDKIRAVTAQDIQNLAQELLMPDHLTTVLVGNPVGVTSARIVESLPHVE